MIVVLLSMLQYIAIVGDDVVVGYIGIVTTSTCCSDDVHVSVVIGVSVFIVCCCC